MGHWGGESEQECFTHCRNPQHASRAIAREQVLSAAGELGRQILQSRCRESELYGKCEKKLLDNLRVH